MNINDIFDEEEMNNNDGGSLSNDVTVETESRNLNNLEEDIINSRMEKKAGKRPRENSEESEDYEQGYTTVTRRKPKKIIRSEQINLFEEGKIEVCITSLEILPKQMAMAKLLRDLNIQNITKIKYRSPYKVFIQFDKRDQAEKLVVNKKITELNARCQFVDEVNICYGVIRGIELDYSEKDILETLRSSCEILSVRRLKRSVSEGKWEDSETVRVGFKAQTTPSHVYAYGCRLQVENYVFPVTQCSGCWKFGHIKKYCPLNKIICPKCGLNHDNCEVETYKCPNCKGLHMALDKSCPMFLKEKQIRKIMTEESITYRKALKLYLTQNNQNCVSTYNSNKTLNASAHTSTKKTYAEAINTVAIIHREEFSDDIQDDLEEEQVEISKKSSVTTQQTGKKKILKEINQENISNKQVEAEVTNINYSIEGTADKEKRNERKKSFEFRRLWFKFKEIIMSAVKFEDKIELLFKMIIEECKLFMKNVFNDWSILQNLCALFDG